MPSRIIIATMVFLCSLGPPPVRAQGRFPLKEHETRNTEDPLIAAGCQWFPRHPRQSVVVKGLPKGLSAKASFFTMEIGGKQVWLALISSKKPKLYVDTDGDGDLSDEQVISGTRKRRGSWLFAQNVDCFGPVALTIKVNDKDATVRLMFEGHNGAYLAVHPASYRIGQIRVGGSKYRVAVMDGDFDGQYASGWPTSRSRGEKRVYDYLAIDLNGNGEFGHDYSRYGKTEIRPVSDLIRIEDAYYEIKLAGDGSAIQLNKATLAMGTLDAGCPDAELVVFSACGLEHLERSDGKWELPAGKYRCWMASLTRTDRNKDRWTLQSNGETGKLERFEIEAGKTLAVKMGPPLKVKTDQRRGFSFFGKTISIGVTIVGQAGEEYAAGVEKNSQRLPAPKLKIFDRAGKTLATGQFEYG